MPEYLELLAACESEAASSKLAAILKLANENVENVAEQKRRREEEERQRQRRFLYSLACWGCFTFATLFFVAGIVLWPVFGDRMPYVFAGLGWLFVVALILYIAVFVLAGKKRREERQQEDIDGSYVVFIVGIVALMVVCIVAGILGAIFQ